MKIHNFPLIKITIFFAFGILFAHFFKPNIFLVALFGIIILLIHAFIFYKSFKQGFNNVFFGIFTFLSATFIGIFVQVEQNDILNKRNYINQIENFDTNHILEIKIKEKLKFSEYSSRFLGIIQKVDNTNSSGKIIVNIKKDSIEFSSIDIGCVLKINELVVKNKPNKNPNQFDYAKYLTNQNIFAQVYCEPSNLLISNKKSQDIWFYASQFRSKIISNLKNKGFNNKELAVIVALILGQQQDIAPDIIKDYQLAGAVHILSVSGLHVGFILIFIGFVLKPFPNTTKWKFIKLTITIVSLWLFGFVAGLAPSVLRSVVMFSFVAFGRYLGRGVNIYNTLFVSAFLILLFKPSFLFDVGFQLSYISLFFIVWLQPLFSKLWQPNNKILFFFWEIITVSFAAQIGAMGLSIYYFHQFPGLFFITNLIVLPAIGFILGYGVFVMILAYFDFLPIFLMKILEKSVWVLNQVIGYIASFEDFVLKDISLNKTMVCTFYVLIFATIYYFKKPKFKSLITALIAIIILQTSLFYSKYHIQKQSEFIVFNVSKNAIFSKRVGQKANIYANDLTLRNIAQNNIINQYLIGNFSTIHSKKVLPKMLYFDNKKILIIDKYLINPSNLNPDILIITNSPKLNLDRFLQICQPKLVVADASNYKSYVQIWKKTCEKHNIYFHGTYEKGFFKIE